MIHIDLELSPAGMEITKRSSDTINMPVNITFRTQLIGSVTEFCSDCGLGLFAKALNLVELIVALARYKEEGVRLNPQVYVSSDIRALTAMLPDGERLRVGATTPDAKGIKEALKKTAPLATDGWCVYLEDRDQLEYGVFRGSGNPLAVAMDEVLLVSVAPLTVVKVFSIADECVEVRASNGSYHHVFLDHRKDDTPPPLKYLDSLVNSITKKCSEDMREALGSFLKKVLFTAMRESHGCIVAVTNMRRPPAFIANDGTILESPIDFSELVNQLPDQQDGSALPGSGSRYEPPDSDDEAPEQEVGHGAEQGAVPAGSVDARVLRSVRFAGAV